MANTIIVPEVYADMLTEGVKENLRISALADTLDYLTKSKEGDGITFPMFKELSDAELIKKGDTVSLEELSQTSTKKTVFRPAKGVEIYDDDSETALGNWTDNAILQQRKKIVRKIDDEMVTDIDKNIVLKVATGEAKKITDDELMQGFQSFGDEQDNDDFAGIVINSLLTSSFYKMDSFIKSDSTTSTKYNGRVVNGVIGFYRSSIPVILSDVNTFDNTKGECKTYIVKKHALGLMPLEEGIRVAVQRNELKFKTDIVASTLTACGLILKDGVCLLKKTITSETK